MPQLTVLEYIEDFDNAELPDGERFQILIDKVIEFNEEHGVVNPPMATVNRYFAEQRRKQYEQ